MTGTAQLIASQGGITSVCEGEMTAYDRVAFELIVRVIREPDGFSAIALRLPGVCGQGDSVEEAINDVVAAFRLAAEEYLESEGQIPWTKVDSVVDGEFVVDKRIVVDV